MDSITHLLRAANRVKTQHKKTEAILKKMEVIDVGIENFRPIAYSCNSGCWLVDFQLKVATYCCDTTFDREDWKALYPPTGKEFQEFLSDPDWEDFAFPDLNNSQEI